MNSMISRKTEDKINFYIENYPEKTLVVLGARQVGKTTIIKKCIESHSIPCVERSFKNNTELQNIFKHYKNPEDLLMRLSLYNGGGLTGDRMLFFFDDVEECPEALEGFKVITPLVRGEFYCIVSGTPRGSNLEKLFEAGTESLELVKIHPLSFKEFAEENGVTERVCNYLENAFNERAEIDPFVHQKLMDLFHKYLVVGGMPEAVSIFLENEDYDEIHKVHQKIISLMQEDISSLDPKDKHYMQKIFSIIPEELSKHNKRFIMKNLGENFKFSRQRNSFFDMRRAGLTHISYCVDEPVAPLEGHREDNLFKMYMPDVGLLTSLYGQNTSEKLLDGETIQNGAICENAIAQEIVYRQKDLYYFSSHQYGEIDFLLNMGDKLLPILIKEGKNYQRHNGMYSLLHSEEYDFCEGIVLGDESINVHGREIRIPIYMISFIGENIR